MIFCVEMIGSAILTILAVKTVYNIGHFFYSVYFAAALGRNINPRKYGPWAVVTGSTDGIGLAFAQKFASLGLNVVLISRNPAKLQRVADELRKDNKLIQVKTIAVDFTDGVSIYPKIRAQLAPLSIGILVNNVGMGVLPGLLNEVHTEDGIGQMINCNVMSMARLTNMVLPSMRKKKRGIIINLGSLLGNGTTPLATLYGATKAFVDKFSQDVAAECRQDGIIVQSLMAGGVATNMAKMKGKPTVSIPDPEVFVEAQLRTLGIETRTSGYWVHKILLFVSEMMNFYIPDTTQKLTIKFFKKIRTELIKLEQQKK